MDDLDRKILGLLQVDATLSLAEIAERVGLSNTPCWRRIQNLEKQGVIKQRVALLDADKLNLGTTVFVRVNTADHTTDWLKAFARAVESIEEITEVYRLGGDIDYLLRIVVPDIKGYDAVYKRLIDQVPLSDVSASFSMEKIKETTSLPLGYAG
ncbi:Lrp/AsnC family transcriptional regulator [Rhodovibrionaceae bacterium A322]